MSFCYFWALDMAPTYAVPGLFGSMRLFRKFFDVSKRSLQFSAVGKIFDFLCNRVFFGLFSIFQKLSIRFERNFLQVFYTILRFYMCNFIKIVWLRFESVLEEKCPGPTPLPHMRLWFRYFATNWIFKKPKQSPLLQFSALWDFQNDCFSYEIRFSQYIPTNNLFQYYPKFWRNIRSEALYPNFWHYIRTLYFCVLLWMRRRFGNSNFSWKHPISMKTHILKTFWALDIAPTLDVPVLFSPAVTVMSTIYKFHCMWTNSWWPSAESIGSGSRQRGLESTKSQFLCFQNELHEQRFQI